MPAEGRVSRPRVGLIESLHAGLAGVRWLDRHLARMRASAAALGLPFPGEAIAAALAAEGAKAKGPSKLRVELAPDGGFAVDLALLPATRPDAPAPVAILAHARLDSRNPLLRHKTTERALYDAERARLAGVPGGFDAIFLNERGELAEGAIANVFLLLDGRLVTPPIACGLLPGVMRAHAIASYGAEERVLTLRDLRAARRVFLTNAVRGMVEVKVFD